MAVDIKLLGSNFSEITGKRNLEFSGNVTINSNINISSLEELKNSKNSLKVVYSINIDYADLGKITIAGNLFISSDEKTIKSLIDSRKENKANTEENIALTNLILKKASLKAFELEEDLGLPLHIKLPSLEVKN